MRSEHGGLQLLGRRNVRDGAALLHHHTNTDARERYAAHWREVAGFVVIVHRRHREDDGVERLLRELLVDVKRWSDSKGHLMAGPVLRIHWRCPPPPFPSAHPHKHPPP